MSGKFCKKDDYRIKQEKLYEFFCIRCGKIKKTDDDTKLICSACTKRSKLTIGQTNIFGEVITK